MRRILVLLALATMLVVITAVGAYADYWPPDLSPPALHLPIIPAGQ